MQQCNQLAADQDEWPTGFCAVQCAVDTRAQTMAQTLQFDRSQSGQTMEHSAVVGTNPTVAPMD